MILAQETCGWFGSINLPVTSLLVQLLTLGYLVYAFRRIAKNQVELAEYLKRRLEKDDDQ